MNPELKDSTIYMAEKIQSEAQIFSQRLSFFLSGLGKYMKSMDASEENTEDEIEIEEEGIDSTTVDNNKGVSSYHASEMHDIYNPMHTVQNSEKSTRSHRFISSNSKAIYVQPKSDIYFRDDF